jgi:hypothetical protein
MLVQNSLSRDAAPNRDRNGGITRNSGDRLGNSGAGSRFGDKDGKGFGEIGNFSDVLKKFPVNKFVNSTKLEKIIDELKNRTRSYLDKKFDDKTGDDDTVKRPAKSEDKDILFAGRSGLIKVKDAANQFTVVRFRKLFDSDGQTAKDFEDAVWSWTAPQDVTVDGLKAKNFSASLTSSTGGVDSFKLAVHGLIFSENGTIDYAGQKLDVYAGAVKISYLVSNWPFKSTNSSLFYAVTVSSSGRGVYSDNVDTLSIGNGMFNTPTVAILDGKATDIKVRGIVDQDADNGTQVAVIFEFPYFSDSLYYDPISALRADDMSYSSNSAVFFQSSMFALTFLSLLFGMIAL